MGKPRVSIMLTECVEIKGMEGGKFHYQARTTAIPVTRIAKVQSAGLNKELIGSCPPETFIELRTPQGGIYVLQTVAEVNEAMNGDVRAKRRSILTHGDNKDCPQVLDGSWRFCKGHAQEIE